MVENSPSEPVAENPIREPHEVRVSPTAWIPNCLVFTVLFYLASFAPALWTLPWSPSGCYWLHTIYRPILMSCKYGPAFIRDGFNAYVNFPFSPRLFDIDDNGEVWHFVD